MDGHQADVAEQVARRASRGRSPCPERYLLGAAVRGAMARSTELLWPTHHLATIASFGGAGREYGSEIMTRAGEPMMPPSK